MGTPVPPEKRPRKGLTRIHARIHCVATTDADEELFPASIVADTGGLSFLEFFKTDKDTGRTKGIIAIDLGGLE